MGASVLSDMISYGTVLGAVMETDKAQSWEQFYVAASENNHLQWVENTAIEIGSRLLLWRNKPLRKPIFQTEETLIKSCHKMQPVSGNTMFTLGMELNICIAIFWTWPSWPWQAVSYLMEGGCQSWIKTE